MTEAGKIFYNRRQGVCLCGTLSRWCRRAKCYCRVHPNHGPWGRIASTSHRPVHFHGPTLHVIPSRSGSILSCPTSKPYVRTPTPRRGRPKPAVAGSLWPMDDGQELHRPASLKWPEPSRYRDAFARAMLLIGRGCLIYGSTPWKRVAA